MAYYVCLSKDPLIRTRFALHKHTMPLSNQDNPKNIYALVLAERPNNLLSQKEEHCSKEGH